MWRLDLVMFSSSWRGLAAMLVLVGTAHAQIPPPPAEVAAYHGLHAAAAKGDLATLQAALRDKSDLNARDGFGRTPVHVAAHFKQREIMRELARAGADMRAKDSQAYDAITIAAVNADAETGHRERAG